MPLTPNEDGTIRALATYLKDGLNAAGVEHKVEVVKAIAVTHSTPFRNLPLLGVYRTGSSRMGLEESDIEIVYYLGSLADLGKLEGILRWVEVKLVQLLGEYAQSKQCIDIVGYPSTQYRILQLNDTTMLPHLRMSVTIRDYHLA